MLLTVAIIQTALLVAVILFFEAKKISPAARTNSIMTEYQTIQSEGSINPEEETQPVTAVGNSLAVPKEQPLLKKKSSLRMEIDFKDQMMKLLKDPNYLAIMFGSCLLISSTTVFPTIMEQVLLPYHYHSSLCDTYGVIFNACGIGFGLVTMILLNKTHAFKMFTIIITVMTFLSYVLLQFSVSTN